MTTIQDRLRDQRWDQTQYYPFENAFLHEAADRIDALEKALDIADTMVEASKAMKYGEAPLEVFVAREEYRAARAAVDAQIMAAFGEGDSG